ncbi:hydroxylamine reductase [Deltaproteobacteria bacterium Smac51]|nr:hydroxylamine reductase [Deltaproteobacteria bacterium Smac51]
MFCWQCEQTRNGTGCEAGGVCGKKPEVADLQDLLRLILTGLSKAALAARAKGHVDNEIDRFTIGAVFSTITNVDFDPPRFQELINKAAAYRDQLKQKADMPECDCEEMNLKPAETLDSLIKQAADHSAYWHKDLPEAATLGLRETAVYGLKGLCAYADHASVLGQEDENLFKFVYECLAATRDKSLTLDDWLAMALKVGEMNVLAMKLLDDGNTGAYGHPVPTKVPLGPKTGKAIVVSGHDLKDLKMLLEQTKGKGINIYTHGEMLPTHGYPELKKYPHFHGHFGTAWQHQTAELPEFPGPVLFTTNCIQRPGPATGDRTFTTGLVGWPGMPQIKADSKGHKDFTPIIEKALSMPGYDMDEDKGEVMVGFGHNAVLSVADKVVELVKSGKIKRFILVGGCDGAKPGRNYYTELVDKAPQDTIILTLACGKFRFFDHKLGEFEGLPRLLDIGQCNDAYSAVIIAQALAKAFDCEINDLPLSLVLSWYEQKACAVLLSLLYLGIKNMRLGPTLPAFIHPDVLNVLHEKLNLTPIGTPEDDLKAMFAQS